MTSGIVKLNYDDRHTARVREARLARNTKQRMLASAVQLFQRHGYNGTGFREVVAHSGAPRGSIYHHFPGGKAQLVEEATRYGGDFIAAGMAAALEEDDPLSALDDFAEYWRTSLIRSDFSAGCPVAAAAIEGDQ